LGRNEGQKKNNSCRHKYIIEEILTLSMQLATSCHWAEVPYRWHSKWHLRKIAELLNFLM
jgi:hypothetical protein